MNLLKKLTISTLYFLNRSELGSTFSACAYTAVLIIGLFIKDEYLIFIGTILTAANNISASIRNKNERRFIKSFREEKTLK